MLEIAPGGRGESQGAGASRGRLPRWTEPRQPRSGRTRGERGGAATGRARPAPLFQGSTPVSALDPCASDEAQAPVVRHHWREPKQQLRTRRIPRRAHSERAGHRAGVGCGRPGAPRS
ncbi:hypothetical protein NDU88_001479 [Pleurodeles waltl]|uniref:Uncharacterized protein n=1 Tax=Pleurodeles waltl TaxID=8319 RepID=A0AAV7VZ36_PLEWA|nr:hypothetical protein NDU88_001479 [Pleurodeles waltl]